MGYSQKEFYRRDKGFGVSYFKSMEEKGKTSKAAAADLPTYAWRSAPQHRRCWPVSARCASAGIAG